MIRNEHQQPWQQLSQVTEDTLCHKTGKAEPLNLSTHTLPIKTQPEEGHPGNTLEGEVVEVAQFTDRG